VTVELGWRASGSDEGMEIEGILAAAEGHGASDIVLCEGSPAALKLHQEMLALPGGEVGGEAMRAFWRACGADPDVETDHDAAYVGPGGGRYRVNLHRRLGHLAAVLRRIRADVPGIETIGVPAQLLASWAERRSGIVIISGPTGSGKSTTIAALLDWVNQHYARHIVTIEDPIEFLFTPRRSVFTQRQVGVDTASFAKGLRASLRQAPDIILVGEIRDAESAAIALQAAETGHLVVTTLHTERAVEAIERAARLFDKERPALAYPLLAEHVVGVLCQKLVPRVDEGVTLVVEHLENVGAVRQWIRAGEFAKIQDFLRADQSGGNGDFLRSILAAYEAGIISEATAIEASGSETEFRRAARGIV
jgi:pilus retraction protein PilT